MNIIILGSMAAAKEMAEAARILEKQGHICILPRNTEKYATGEMADVGGIEGAQRKLAGDLVRKHYQYIKDGDVVLAVNSVTKHGVQYYVGGNTFWELGFAHIENKPVVLMQPPNPEQWYFYQELVYLEPLVLNGNLDSFTTKLAEWYPKQN